MEKKTIADLPNEILLYTFEFIKRNSAILREVCKLWKTLILERYPANIKVPIFLSSIETEELFKWGCKREAPISLALVASKGSLESFHDLRTRARVNRGDVLLLAVKLGYSKIVELLIREWFHCSELVLIEAAKLQRREILFYLFRKFPNYFCPKLCFALARTGSINFLEELFSYIHHNTLFGETFWRRYGVKFINGAVSGDHKELFDWLLEKELEPNYTTWYYIPLENSLYWETRLLWLQVENLVPETTTEHLLIDFLPMLIKKGKIPPEVPFYIVNLYSSSFKLLTALIKKDGEKAALDCFVKCGNSLSKEGISGFERIMFKENRVDLMVKFVQAGLRASSHSRMNIFLYAHTYMIRAVNEAGYFN